MTRVQSIVAAMKARIASSVEGRRFCEVNDIVKELRDKGVFDAEFAAEAILYLEKELVRQVMRRKGEDGYPLFPSISITDAVSGKKRRVYMREKHMRPPQYRQVADFWIGYHNYGEMMANETIERCNRRYHTQWELPFPGAGGQPE